MDVTTPAPPLGVGVGVGGGGGGGGGAAEVAKLGILEIRDVLGVSSDDFMAKKYVVLAESPLTIMFSNVPAEDGFGSPETPVAELKFPPVIADVE